MASTMTCTACRATLQVGNLTAGQQVRCPRCQAVVTVPPEDLVEVAVMEAQPVPGGGPSRVGASAGPNKPCPRCGQSIALAARKCRHCKAWLDEEEEEEAEEYRSSYKPCPRCGAGGAARVVFTFWGSFYGPALFSHVRCPECGYAYNGKSGHSNFVPALLFVSIPALLILLIVVGLIWLIARVA